MRPLKCVKRHCWRGAWLRQSLDPTTLDLWGCECKPHIGHRDYLKHCGDMRGLLTTLDQNQERFEPGNAAECQRYQLMYVCILLAVSMLSNTYSYKICLWVPVTLHSMHAIFWRKRKFRQQHKP